MNTERLSIALVLLAGVGLGGCTTLGPMAATTGMIAAPAGRPDVSVQAGAVPGYYLSNATQEKPHGSAVGQAAAMIEPDRVIGVKGLSVGGRVVSGQGNDVYGEPMLRYSSTLDKDKRVAAVIVGYGTHASASETRASYTATRGGVEAGADARLTPTSNWAELHIFASASLTGLDANGNYCLDAKGYGMDCGDTDVPVHTVAKGFYPSGTGGIALDFGRHLDSIFHGGSLALMGSVGTMPHLVAAEQKSAATYASGGLTLTLGVGGL